MDKDEEKDRLRKQLEELIRRQDSLAKDIQMLKARIDYGAPSKDIPPQEIIDKTPAEAIPVRVNEANDKENEGMVSLGLERFVGMNLISFLGILILLSGLGIGINYAIQHGLLSPVIRFILGYLAGFLLLAVGYRLLKNYRNYAAILLNGGLAVLYFNSYAATGYYQFFPIYLSFPIMLLLTMATVSLALKIDIQYTAVVGLVGAYGIPFLLGERGGQSWILPVYTLLINGGILYIGFRKNWRLLNYSAFGMSWLIYLSWLGFYGDDPKLYLISLLFATLFFLLFYFLILAYKLIRNEIYHAGDVVMLLVNALVYYLASITIVLHLGHYAGLFTALNAFVHGGILLVLRYRGISDTSFLRLLMGLFLVFITLTIPLQFHGRWITWLWAGEAVALFAAGRGGKKVFYAWLSIFSMALAVISLVIEWRRLYMLFPGDDLTLLHPFLNPAFLESMVVAAASAILYLMSSREEQSGLNLFRHLWLILFAGILYLSFRNEISQYFFSRGSVIHYENELYHTAPDEGLLYLRKMILFLYSCAFLVLLVFPGKAEKREDAGWILILSVSGLLLLNFSTNGLETMRSLQPDRMLALDTSLQLSATVFGLLRYLSYAGAGFLLYLSFSSVATLKGSRRIRIALELFIHFYILFLATSELNMISHLKESWFPGNNAVQTGYSILWGLYALFLVIYGFLRSKRFLRFAGILLVLLVTGKVLFYDLSGLSVLMRILLLIVTGLLMLVMAFFYQRFAGKEMSGQDQH